MLLNSNGRVTLDISLALLTLMFPFERTCFGLVNRLPISSLDDQESICSNRSQKSVANPKHQMLWESPLVGQLVTSDFSFKTIECELIALYP